MKLGDTRRGESQRAHVLNLCFLRLIRVIGERIDGGRISERGDRAIFNDHGADVAGHYSENHAASTAQLNDRGSSLNVPGRTANTDVGDIPPPVIALALEVRTRAGEGDPPDRSSDNGEARVSFETGSAAGELHRGDSPVEAAFPLDRPQFFRNNALVPMHSRKYSFSVPRHDL